MVLHLVRHYSLLWLECGVPWKVVSKMLSRSRTFLRMVVLARQALKQTG